MQAADRTGYFAHDTPWEVLNSDDRIILHLRMTGCLLLTPADYPEEKHTHIIFSLNNGKELRFSDTRRFRRFWLLRKDEADTYSGTHKLGIEPFHSELAAEYLNAHFGKRKKAVKECLLDQSAIAGIGNIYADVILVYAFYQPTFILDAYTRRFLPRLGYEFSDDTAIKKFFEAGLKRDAQLYGWYHWLILEHCISVCKKSPNCE